MGIGESGEFRRDGARYDAQHAADSIADLEALCRRRDRSSRVLREETLAGADLHEGDDLTEAPPLRGLLGRVEQLRPIAACDTLEDADPSVKCDMSGLGAGRKDRADDMCAKHRRSLKKR